MEVSPFSGSLYNEALGMGTTSMALSQSAPDIQAALNSHGALTMDVSDGHEYSSRSGARVI